MKSRGRLAFQTKCDWENVHVRILRDSYSCNRNPLNKYINSGTELGTGG